MHTQRWVSEHGGIWPGWSHWFGLFGRETVCFVCFLANYQFTTVLPRRRLLQPNARVIGPKRTEIKRKGVLASPKPMCPLTLRKSNLACEYIH